MHRLTCIELIIFECFITRVKTVARESNCQKSLNGSLIIARDSTGTYKEISRGSNKTTDFQACVKCLRTDIHDNSRYELCRAIHAEQEAIMRAYSKWSTLGLRDAILFHVRFKNNLLAPRSEPSCTLCANFITRIGIEYIVLVYDGGADMYNAYEFRELSFDYQLRQY
jgi:deoxycytidylate deaminase